MAPLFALIFIFCCSLPNFSLAGAIDVLTTGTYPRLPTCIRSRIVPSGPLSPDENLRVCGILEDVIRKRLIAQPLPPTIAHELTISRGRVVVTVPKEFQVTLTLLGDDPNLPWRLLKLKILTNTQVPGVYVERVFCLFLCFYSLRTVVG